MAETSVGAEPGPEQSVPATAQGWRLATLAQSHGMTPLEPVSNERPDDQNGNRQQPYIPTGPERGVMHDVSSSLCSHEESKHHTVVRCTEIASRLVENLQ